MKMGGWPLILEAGILSMVVIVAAGCAKQSASPAASAPSVQTASGDAIFRANNCGRCHMLGGQGGRMGPDLSHEGANSQHNPQWIVDHVKNPKTHTPGSRMPSFAGKIPDPDIQSLAAYLAGLK